MLFNDYQKFVKSVSPAWTKEDPKNFDACVGWAIMEMTAEAGECLSLAVKAKRKVRTIDDDKLWDELGDTLWGIAAVMNEAFPDKTIEDLMEHNKNKLVDRLSAQVVSA